MIKPNDYSSLLPLSPGKAVSLILFICYFTVLPVCLKIIWPFIIWIPDPYFYLFILLATITLVFGIYNLVMWYIYTAKIPFFQQYRDDDTPWPWQTDPLKWKQTIRKTVGTVVFNVFVLVPLFPILQHSLKTDNYKKSLQNWPSTPTILLQLLFCIFMQDLTFYWSHTAFHSPKLYWIHKTHHEHTNTVSIAAAYAHPIEFVIGNMVPAGIGYHVLGKFCEVHFVVIVVWLVYRLVETCQVHCGYDWSWRQLVFLPWKAGPKYHGFHHSRNVGNFGSMFQIWDFVMKTNKQYYSSMNKSK